MPRNWANNLFWCNAIKLNYISIRREHVNRYLERLFKAGLGAWLTGKEKIEYLFIQQFLLTIKSYSDNTEIHSNLQSAYKIIKQYITMHNSNNVILCMSLYFGNIKSKCLEVINSPNYLNVQVQNVYRINYLVLIGYSDSNPRNWAKAAIPTTLSG